MLLKGLPVVDEFSLKRLVRIDKVSSDVATERGIDTKLAIKAEMMPAICQEEYLPSDLENSRPTMLVVSCMHIFH